MSPHPLLIMGQAPASAVEPAAGLQYTPHDKRLHYTINSTRVHFGAQR